MPSHLIYDQRALVWLYSCLGHTLDTLDHYFPFDGLSRYGQSQTRSSPRYATNCRHECQHGVPPCQYNRLCLICLAPEHAIIKEKKRLVSVDFVGSSGRATSNRLNNKVLGKHKRQAQKLKANSELCLITCEDGTKYTVLSAIKGNLLEINEKIITNPNLLVEQVTICLIGLTLVNLIEFLRHFSHGRTASLPSCKYLIAICSRKFTNRPSAMTIIRN